MVPPHSKPKSKLARTPKKLAAPKKRAAKKTRASRPSRRAWPDLATCFDALFDSDIAGVFLAEHGGRIFDANDAFLAIVGYERADLAAGRLHFTELTAMPDRARNPLVGTELRERGFASPWEKEYVRKDGSRVPVSVGVVDLGARVVAFVTDLTKQKRAAASLRQKEANLHQSQKLEAIARLAGGVAHDFNNLLSVIMTHTELAMEELASGTVKTDLEQVARASKRAAELTRQLMAFSQKQVLEPTRLDANETIAAMQPLLEEVCGDSIRFIASFAPRIAPILAAEDHIEQLIMNLVVNAKDAMPSGGTLSLSTSNVTLSEEEATAISAPGFGPHVLLSVTDTGSGMDAATVAQIFDPFFTTKDRTKRTGLGLSTVFGIVQQAGGVIRVTSEPGRGSRFDLYFPAASEAPRATARGLVATPALRGHETILLVEDEDQVRGAAVAVLRRHGYRVIDTGSPLDALRIVRETTERIHLLLTDVMMPNMRGPELATRVRELRADIRVLCMSGYTEENVGRLKESGFAFLQKPFTPLALAERVRAVLDARG